MDGPILFEPLQNSCRRYLWAGAGFEAGRGAGNLRVLHVVEWCVGGVGTVIDEILDHQIHDARIDAVQVLVDLTRSKDNFISRKSNYMVGYRSSRNPLHFYRVFREINAAIATFQPDVLHLHSSFAGAYVRLFRSGLSVPAPIVYCAHGWSFDQEGGALKRLAYRAVERFLSRRTDAILNVSRYEAEMARRAAVLGSGSGDRSSAGACGPRHGQSASPGGGGMHQSALCRPHRS